MAGTGNENILSIRGLKTYFYLREQNKTVKALDGVDMDIKRGKITAIAGGSGSGKSVLSLSVLGLIDSPGFIKSGEIWFNGINLRTLSKREILKIRGREIAMIFQEPSNALNPVMKIKNHMIEVMRYSGQKMSATEMRPLFVKTLADTGLRNPEKILESYPFELSGGMCQRVIVAMGLLSKSKILIADEPTSSLDLTTQVSILRELYRLRDGGLTIILITHDLGVVAQMADYVYIIRDGQIVENADVYTIFKHPEHEYTKLLLAGIR
jgi:ABC-type dipeptide/oligopeptide/nickel transport system ATPase component